MTYVGAENIVSPLGRSADQVFKEALHGNDALQWHNLQGVRAYASRFDRPVVDESHDRFIHSLAMECMEGSLDRFQYNLRKEKRALLLLSTTKGDIDLLNERPDQASPAILQQALVQKLGWQGDAYTVSNACISGLLATINAQDLIEQGHYDFVLVCGVDLVSRFTASGFASLFAMEEGPCQPFDANRQGINLGEGAASLVLSKTNAFTTDAFEIMAGASANDANHISGPSRTGEGLFRAIQACMSRSKIEAGTLGTINAHGTATRYNDDMESIAFNRCDLQKVPLQSFKGYIGHTLGAAGTMELALMFQSALAGTLLPSKGYKKAGTVKPLNVLQSATAVGSAPFLKTSSGFGGCNAAAIFRHATA